MRLTGRLGGYAGLLLTLVFALFLPLLQSDPVESRDHVDHYLRVEQYAAEVTAGRWPQLLPDPIRGGGHAFPRYYPPLTHFAAVPAYLLTGNAVVATHLTAVLAVLLAALAMLAFLRTAGAPPVAASLGALAYGTMPYQFTLLYVRGAFAEAMAMIWYPLLLLGGWRLMQDRTLPRWWPIVLAALLLTHTATALWAIPALGLAGLAAFGGPRVRIAWKPLVLGTLLAPGLAAFYLVPMQTGLPSVRASDPTVMFIHPEDLAAIGSGLVATGPLILLVTAMGLGGMAALWRLRAREDPATRLLAASLVGLAVVVGVILAPAGPWKLVPEALRYIQFPWRLTGLLVLFASLALGLVAARFRTTLGRRVVYACLGILAIGATARAVVQARETPTLSRAQLQELLDTPYADLGLTYNGDYLPRGVEPLTLARNIDRTRNDLLEAAGSEGWLRDRHGATARITLEAPAQVLLPLTGYTDLWVVRDARSGVTVATTSVEGQLAVMLDAGEHRLDVTERLPWPTRAGIAISILALIVCLRAPAIRS